MELGAPNRSEDGFLGPKTAPSNRLANRQCETKSRRAKS